MPKRRCGAPATRCRRSDAGCAAPFGDRPGAVARAPSAGRAPSRGAVVRIASRRARRRLRDRAARAAATEPALTVGPRGRARGAQLAEGADRAHGARALRDRRRALPVHRRARRRARRRRVHVARAPRAAHAGPRRARARARHARRARAGAAPRGSRAQRARAPRARAAAAHEARTGVLQVREAARQGPRRGRLRCLARPPQAGSDRHAGGLVAAHAVLGLSVTQGVALHARPRSLSQSIVASLLR